MSQKSRELGLSNTGIRYKLKSILCSYNKLANKQETKKPDHLIA